MFILLKRTDINPCSDAYAMRCSFFAFVFTPFGHFGINNSEIPTLGPPRKTVHFLLGRLAAEKYRGSELN